MTNEKLEREINLIHDRLNTQNSTMQAMWQRLQPLTKFYDWAKDTHPELLEQYASVHELEELGKTDRSVAMKAREYGAAQAVKYEVGNGNL